MDYKVAIPSDRGVRSGNIKLPEAYNKAKSQSPLIGAFVPGHCPKCEHIKA